MEPAASQTFPSDAQEALRGLTALGPVDERSARAHALVLQAMSIWHVRRPVLGGWILLVRDSDYDRAAEAIDSYEEENKNWPPRKRTDTLRHPRSFVGWIAFGLLLAFFWVTGPVASQSSWFWEGRSVSSLVIGSEPYRAITALTLHSDSGHALGNFVSGGIFTSAAARRLGWGGGLLSVVLAGAFGNVANAAYYYLEGTTHLSIGASTAVFGAIGILAGTQLLANRNRDETSDRPWLRIFGPIVGGLALLGALGAGPNPRTDYGAHGWGLAAGFVIGLVAAYVQQRSGRHSSPLGQTGLAAAAAGLVIGAWAAALG